ncbi:MAG TPA: HPr family phosphocarrier protein [Devosia sp.]|nr:HPr family phosphocarrier protein [Devosia sp.]
MSRTTGTINGDIQGENIDDIRSPDSGLDCANSRHALVQQMRICNQKGLHARASARFVRTVELFDAQVNVSREGTSVGGTSIMGLMMLAAGPGSSILVRASGPQAREVLDALSQLIDNGFDEDTKGQEPEL